jgi:hypothetical protein
MRYTLLSVLILFLAIACQQSDSSQLAEEYGNPAAPGFNAEASDSMAIVIADSVMEAMGGRKNWDNTRYLSWNFFGRRVHTWDKWDGLNRIEFQNEDLIIEFNVNTKEGKVIQDGAEVIDEAEKAELLQRGYEIWVNDSYWLLMPFKMKDSGVTLTYLGEEESPEGIPSYKLQLTFDEVGVTPQNKYHVFVDTTDYLVKHWMYFPEAEMEEPRISTVWADYQQHGEILLSGNRGRFQLSDIAVLDAWPE